MQKNNDLKWIENFEKHIKALKDMDNIKETRKHQGARNRAKNTYIKMYELDKELTIAMYPHGWS